MTEETKPQNPPAFPTMYIAPETTQGMTLLDFFAGQAMQAMANNDMHFDRIATCAYQIAEAMLKEREKHL